MSAMDEFTTLIENTHVIQQAFRSLKEEPAHILGDICREYGVTGKPVPDHHFHYVGYLGEISVKALLSAGLIRQRPGGRVALYSYEPTPEGQKLSEKLKAEGFYKET